MTTAPAQTSRFAVEKQPLRHTAVVRVSCTMATMKDAIDSALGQLNAHLQQSGAVREPAWFMRYTVLDGFSADGAPIEFEVGVGVAAPVPGDSWVEPSTLPAGRAAVAFHTGRYDTLMDTYAPFHTWIAEQGLEPAGHHWEEYLIDPSQEPDPARWLTRIVQPV